MEVHEKGSVVMHSKLLILFIALAVAPFAWPLPSSSAAAQIRIIPGSAVGGSEIFRDKGCSNCHKFELYSSKPNSIIAGCRSLESQPEDVARAARR